MTRRHLLLQLAAIAAFSLVLSCGDSDPGNDQLTPGQTDFTSNEPPGGGRAGGHPAYDSAAGGEANKAGAPPGAPQGRTGEVEEADIYRVDNNRLFYLNTYRGFVIYDLTDPKKPQRVSRLPVFGYPVEMFVSGNTVYALLRDALYLSQKQGALKFERHNVSQLVAIDISDLENPKVVQTVDIKGLLREGVSRKIEDTIYVVSYMPQWYYWGWGYQNEDPQQKEQAWVYSFNVADPKNPKLVQQLKVFEGGSYSYYDEKSGASGSRSFNDVAISATSNTLMVVENWWTHGWVPDSVDRHGCGTYESSQEAVVSVVDVSDPTGKIALYSRFKTAGQLGDQFKMTYVVDPASGKATYFGIFARQEWSGANCQGSSFTANILEAWDISDGTKPQLASSLQFGKPNETVRGSAFDLERSVAYAITAEQVDPLYVIDISDPADLKVLSEIDGLSGDMNVFRLIANREFLIGIGRDNTNACTGFETQADTRATQVAVSIIDVRELDAIRLVQRQCVAVKDAEWIGSDLNWNLDQAHKMIGMHSDGKVNLITVPIYYYSKDGGDAWWWWYSYKTAVGMMAWDLSKYDETLDETQQQVLTNFGTVLHPQGQVKRSIVFTHQGATARRMMVNLSDTHVSVTDVENLAAPQLQSVIEVAPYYSELYRFGGHIVEHIRDGEYWRSAEGKSEFRVKLAGPGALDETPAVASFTVGQVQRVIAHGDKLVLFRVLPSKQTKGGDYYYSEDTEVLVYDLSDPTKPKAGGTLELAGNLLPYYSYWCGVRGYWGGYWFDSDRNWTLTDSGVVFLQHHWDHQTQTSSRKLLFLDLTDLQQPQLTEKALSTSDDWAFFGLLADPVDPASFLLAYRVQVGQVKIDDMQFAQYKYYAQRWVEGSGGWSAAAAINLPGQLVRTWKGSSGERLFLSHDTSYKQVPDPQGNPYWKGVLRLNLLREVEVGGQPAAALLDSHSFEDLWLEGLVIDGDRLFVNARKDWYRGWGYADGPVATAPRESSADVATASSGLTEPSAEDRSDRLMIFDLSALKLDAVYDEPTGTHQVTLMGTYQGRLFVNLPGDGVLVVDVADPAAPKGLQFMRTLGYASHIEFAGDQAYVAAGYFGVYQLKLTSSASVMPTY